MRLDPFCRRPAIALLAWLLAPGAAFADRDEGHSPRAEGTSEEDQQKASRLYHEGNEFFDKFRFAEAAARYREAVKHWPHPMIYYNLAMSLIGLNQWLDEQNVLEVHDSARQAIRHGPKALGDAEYREMLELKRAMEARIGRIAVTARQPDVRILVDGRELPLENGKATRILRPGKHVVTAERPEHLPETRQIDLFPGQEATIPFQLVHRDDEFEETRRWAPWKPWAVIGTGIALAGLGGLAHWRAIESYNAFDNRFPKTCPNGCPDNAPNSPIDEIRRPDLLKYSSWTAYGLGSAALATGLVFLYLNRTRTVRKYHPGTLDKIDIHPIATPDQTGVTARLEF